MASTPSVSPATAMERATLAVTTAMDVLEAALAVHGMDAEPSPSVVTYAGQYELEGHYERPGLRRSFDIQLQLRPGRGEHWSRWRVWMRGPDQEPAQMEQWVAADGGWRRGGDSEPWVPIPASRLPTHRIDMALIDPIALLDIANEDRAWVRAELPRPDTDDHAAGTRLYLPDRQQGLWSLELDPQTQRVESVTHVYPHPRLGDVTETATHGDYVMHQGRAVPSSIEVSRIDSDPWSMTLKLDDAPSSTPPPEHRPDPVTPVPSPATDEPSDAGTSIEIDTVAPGVHTVTQTSNDARMLVVEFTDHLAVIEPPVSSAVSEPMVAAIEQHWPQKPIRHALFSHHHPHHCGGLRALMAVGATVWATPNNIAVVEEIAARSFRLSPDRFARTLTTIEVRSINEQAVLEDDSNRLVMRNIGSSSRHTDEYVVFYLPQAKLVFDGDLGYYTKADGQLAVSSRTQGLLKVIDTQGWAVERVIPAWPVQGNAPQLELGEIRTLFEDLRKSSP